MINKLLMNTMALAIKTLSISFVIFIPASESQSIEASEAKSRDRLSGLCRSRALNLNRFNKREGDTWAFSKVSQALNGLLYCYIIFCSCCILFQPNTTKWYRVQVGIWTLMNGKYGTDTSQHLKTCTITLTAPFHWRPSRWLKKYTATCPSQASCGSRQTWKPSKIEVSPWTFGLSKSIIPIEVPFGSLITWAS